MKAFVSSTSRDLTEAREQVCERLLQVDVQPVSMNTYRSAPDSPKTLDCRRVGECDAFVIIVGHLYGSAPAGEQESFTELEYEAARKTGRPVFAFLASKEFPYSPDLREDDETYQKLVAFRKRLETDHAPRSFDNIDQLCTEVLAALSDAGLARATTLDHWATVTRRLQECLARSPYLKMPCLGADISEFDAILIGPLVALQSATVMIPQCRAVGQGCVVCQEQSR